MAVAPAPPALPASLRCARWLDELVITTKDKLPSCSADALSKIVSALPLLAGDTGAQGYRLAQVVAQAQVGRGRGPGGASGRWWGNRRVGSGCAVGHRQSKPGTGTGKQRKNTAEWVLGEDVATAALAEGADPLAC